MIPNTRTYSAEELAPLSESVEVAWLNADKGYGLVCKRAVGAGEAVITRERPLVATLNPGPQDRCSFCWKRLVEFDFRCDCGLHYCSIECQFDHGKAHSVLCSAQVDSDKHPLIAFKLHAIKTNPMFLTSAWGVALVLAHPAEMTARLANFQHLAWELAVPPPLREEEEEANVGEEEGEEEEDFAKILFDLAHQAQTQLEQGLLALQSSSPSAIKLACDTYFSPLLGVLERNQFEIQIEDGGEEQEACGAGIFTLCCVLNHSCEPNAEISFESGTNHATVRATRPIAAGEEVFISYVDSEDSLQERQEQLRDYGFVCECARCRQELEWMAQQRELAKRVVADRCDSADFAPKLVGGFDISFPEAGTSNPSVACLCVLTLPDLKVVYEAIEECEMSVPYIPGFLAFREADVCRRMLAGVPLALRPEVLVLDGNGVMHPRQCGLASHVGVVCDLPTIGVSKNLLAVDGLTRDSVKLQTKKMLSSKVREWDLVGNSGRVWGRAFVPPTAKSNAVFVSVGHRLDLATAMGIVRQCCHDSRVPAPVRHADLASRQAVRNQAATNNY